MWSSFLMSIVFASHYASYIISLQGVDNRDMCAGAALIDEVHKTTVIRWAIIPFLLFTSRICFLFVLEQTDDGYCTNLLFVITIEITRRQYLLCVGIGKLIELDPSKLFRCFTKFSSPSNPVRIKEEYIFSVSFLHRAYLSTCSNCYMCIPTAGEAKQYEADEYLTLRLFPTPISSTSPVVELSIRPRPIDILPCAGKFVLRRGMPGSLELQPEEVGSGSWYRYIRKPVELNRGRLYFYAY
ncbi:hypothetical protein MTR67_051346 [Solanum verrucosum]|uniref:Uncharacterized protein n=1 Tax=Solanum verrucosum TaxID=315347 RepID=A0AAF1A019_SOLVR|nr:hypothetical protein MTR67_051346 [Solanum verrucosum]